MSATIRAVARDTGWILHVPGFLALSVIPLAIGFQEWSAVRSFLATGIVTLIAAQVLCRVFRKSEEMRLRHAMATSAIAWLAVGMAGAAPFWLLRGHAPEFGDGLNALFEGFSGFTSTGLSVAVAPSKLPRSLQWWRSLMEWVGGVGVIVMILAILAPAAHPYLLYYAEGRHHKFFHSVSSTVRTTWWIYALLTGFSVTLLLAAGMPLWEAANHGLTGISTGGFTVTDDSMAGYALETQLAVALVMILGAISFSTYRGALNGPNPKILWRDPQLRIFAAALAAGACVVYAWRWAEGESPLWREVLFQCASALATCGFSTAQVVKWNSGAKGLLSVGMVIGGSAGSTVGGLKVSRIHLLTKGLGWQIKRWRGGRVTAKELMIGTERLSREKADKLVQAAFRLTLLWLAILALGALILAAIAGPAYSLADALLEAASALGCVGLSTGITHPRLAGTGKLTLIALMWMGRLEIVPVLLLFAQIFGFKGQALIWVLEDTEG